MFVFMGNRVGSPPSSSGGGGEEQPEEEADGDEDETVQTGITGAVAGAAAAAAGAVSGSGSPPVDGETPDEDAEDGDDVSPDDNDEGSKEDPEVPEEIPEDPPVEPEQPTDGDGFESAEPAEKPTESDSEEETENEEAPEDEDDLDDDDEDSRFVYGDIVFDRDSVDEDEVEEADTELSVVVNLPDASIREWECGEDETVADRDSHYPPTDDVVVVVERGVLDAVAPAWDERESEILIEKLDAVGVEYTAYPSLRLGLYEPSHLRK